jgi:hypothetical protein
MTVEALTALVESELERRAEPCVGGGAENLDDDGIDGEPCVRWRLACPARLRPLWRTALDLARRVAGEEVATWQAAELIAAEGIAARPAGSVMGDRVLAVFTRLVRRFRRHSHSAGRRTG